MKRSPQEEGPMLVAGTCSPVNWMYVKPCYPYPIGQSRAPSRQEEQSPNDAPLRDSLSGGSCFTGPWTSTRSSLRMLRRVVAFCCGMHKDPNMTFRLQLHCNQRKNSIAFGSAPRREVDSQPISP